MTLDYKPSEEFEVSKLQSLLDFDVTTGAKELWLIQCPTTRLCSPLEKALSPPAFLFPVSSSGAQPLLHRRSAFSPPGHLSLSAGKLLSLSNSGQLLAFLSRWFSQILVVKKISRRVSLVRFPKPEELLETMKVKTKRKLAGAAVTSSSVRNSNPAQSSRRKSGQSSLRHSTSNSQKSVFPSSSTKTLMSSSKRKHSEPSSSKHHSSATTVPGSSDRSDKSKKKDKAIEKEITNLSRNKSGASSEVSKLDTSSLVASDVNTPEIFDVQTRNDLEYVKIPRDSKVKTPETPKAKEAEDQEVSFSENWEVKFPEELEATKTSEVFKVADQSKLQQVSKVSAPKLSQVKVKKEPDVPEVLDDRSVTEVLEVHAPSEVSGIKVS
ncbi:hypothetical protein IGI04_024005 [Brassica rapa subsp. trilocularis]|uniref:Uncharacterized protein n=1 Tax=Brassica rapa subsp. trilocularis TaxID=1813537 RepID=A0ABQ7M5F7_BRACM|nr:hypothetical protein IGI04_024005 [Brassica rapa subsp. trilocularis]